METNNTATATATRGEFSNVIRYARALGVVASYGRMGAFGRSIIFSTGERFTFTAWTSAPNLNIHRVTGGAR